MADRFWQKNGARYELAKAGHKWVQKHLRALEPMSRAYQGQYFLEGAEPEENIIENSYHDWISYIIPKSTANHPKFRVTTRKGGDRARFEAKGYELALNQIARDMRMRNFIAKGPAVDMQFMFGITLATRHVDPRRRTSEYAFIDGPQMMPRLYRIAPDWWFEDPSTFDRDGIRYYGWRPFEDKELLRAMAEEDDTWDKDAIEAMQTQYADPDNYILDRSRPGTNEWIEEAPVGYMYVHESEEGVTLDGHPHPGPSEGYNGTLYTFDWQTGHDLREPIAWFGAPEGPCTMYGAYQIPNDPVMAGPLVIVENQTRNLNRLADAIVRASEAYKRLIVADSRDTRLVDAIKNAPHDYVVPLRNFDKSKVAELEMAGVSELQMIGYQIAKAQVDRNMSFHDTQRGIAPGSGTTATAVNAAAGSTDIRLEGILGSLYEGVEADGRKILHNLVFDQSIVVPVSHEVLQEGKIEMLPAINADTGEYIIDQQTGEPLMQPAGEVIFMGGNSYLSYADLDLELVPESMPRSEEGLKQNMKLAAIDRIVGMLPIAREHPELKLREVTEMLADAFNDPALTDLIDLDMTQSRPQASATRTVSAPGSSPASVGAGSRPQGGGQRRYPATGTSGSQTGGLYAHAMSGRQAGG